MKSTAIFRTDLFTFEAQSAGASPFALLVVGLLVLLLAGCASRPPAGVPIEDRGTGMTGVRPAQPMPLPDGSMPGGVKPLLGIENAGKPGYYTVKPGDTLIRIGLENGQNWRDIMRWNLLENPNLIEVGQVIRVVPPSAILGAENPLVVTRPVLPGMATPLPPGAPAAVPAPVGSDENIAWIWPAQGVLIAGFDEAKNKGLDIGGKAGDAIIAAADGRVVYAGAGLRGYGNLVILKHNNTFLTAYAHNQTLLVKEDQAVKKGQKIAEMGNSDADRVKLHFEIRRQGKPVDPARYLPPR